MKTFLATLWLTTNALMAATSDRAANSIPTDGLGNAIHANAAADADADAAARPKPTADEHRAQKSRRMAERRERVRQAIANLPNDPDSVLQPMSAAELDAALEAAKLQPLRAKERFGDNYKSEVMAETEQNIRVVRQQMSEMSDEERKLYWGSGSFGHGGGNDDPYAPAGGLSAETTYYSESRVMGLTGVSFRPGFHLPSSHAILPRTNPSSNQRQVGAGIPLPRGFHRLLQFVGRRVP